ncbi:MAG: hypothetical protein VYD57_05790 [Pseudomonadota bacterium]|nr:hypothetical protein [Pseudomonadota bacterium]
MPFAKSVRRLPVECSGSDWRAARSAVLRRRSMTAVLLGGLAFVAGGCTGPEGSPVLGAVFGLEDASTKSFRMGRIPVPTVRPGDDLIGQAANSPGECIWRRAGSSRRFQAACPDGYEP